MCRISALLITWLSVSSSVMLSLGTPACAARSDTMSGRSSRRIASADMLIDMPRSSPWRRQAPAWAMAWRSTSSVSRVMRLDDSSASGMKESGSMTP
jgi:hypothetical protein